MVKFGINDLIDIKKKESKVETVDEYKEIWLNPRVLFFRLKEHPICRLFSTKGIPYKFSVTLLEHSYAHYLELKIPLCKLIAQGYFFPERSEWKFFFFCQGFRIFILQVRI